MSYIFSQSTGLAKKEKLLPVATVKHCHTEETAESTAIECMLSEDANMFIQSETIRDLMRIEGLTIARVAEVLMLKPSVIAEKLRLLEYSEKEREAIISGSICERSAVSLLALPKDMRKAVLAECIDRKLDCESTEELVGNLLSSGKTERKTIRKAIVRDIGLFLNSVDHAVNIAKEYGYDVQKNQTDDGKTISLDIKVKRAD